jgi:solute carrier family 50 protein (sugar transporter)
MTGNCLGWVAYAVAKQDLFVLFSNAPGLVLSLWLNMGAAKLQYQEMHQKFLQNDSHSLHLQMQIDGGDEGEQESDVGSRTSSTNTSSPRITNIALASASLPSLTPHEIWVIRVVIIWVITLSTVCFVPMSVEKQANIIGLIVNINLVVFYGAPLSTILNVVSKRNSASIHRRTMIMSLFNSFFWLVYGVALMDIVIFLPNACGFAMGVVQLVLCVVFSSKVDVRAYDSNANAEERLVGEDRASIGETQLV